MKHCLPALAVLALALHLSAAETNSSPLMKIGTADAKNFYGREMIVTGQVAQVNIRPGIVFLNMDKPYPESPFTLIIFPAATNKFGNLRSLRGATIEATGTITNYHNRAEIVLEKAKQLKVTRAATANAPIAKPDSR